MNRKHTLVRLINESPLFVGDHEQATDLARKILADVVAPIEDVAFRRGYKDADDFHTDREG